MYQTTYDAHFAKKDSNLNTQFRWDSQKRTMNPRDHNELHPKQLTTGYKSNLLPHFEFNKEDEFKEQVLLKPAVELREISHGTLTRDLVRLDTQPYPNAKWNTFESEMKNKYKKKTVLMNSTQKPWIKNREHFIGQQSGYTRESELFPPVKEKQVREKTKYFFPKKKEMSGQVRDNPVRFENQYRSWDSTYSSSYDEKRMKPQTMECNKPSRSGYVMCNKFESIIQ